jgi:hypothetical protein
MCFVSFNGYRSQDNELTVTLYSVAHSKYLAGTNSTTFQPVHLHFQSIFGDTSIGQGNLSLLSRLVSGIKGILKSAIIFCEIFSRLHSGRIFVTFAHEIASNMTVKSFHKAFQYELSTSLLTVSEYSCHISKFWDRLYLIVLEFTSSTFHSMKGLNVILF